MEAWEECTLRAIVTSHYHGVIALVLHHESDTVFATPPDLARAPASVLREAVGLSVAVMITGAYLRAHGCALMLQGRSTEPLLLGSGDLQQAIANLMKYPLDRWAEARTRAAPADLGVSAFPSVTLAALRRGA